MKVLFGVLASILMMTNVSVANSMEDIDYIQERLHAHSHAIDGSTDPAAFAGRYRAQLTIPFLKRNIDYLADFGFGEDDARALKKGLSKIDLDTLGKEAMKEAMSTFVTLVEANASLESLVRAHDAADQADGEAMVSTFNELTSNISGPGQEVLAKLIDERIAHTKMIYVDYLGIAQDIPEYARIFFKSVAQNWGSSGGSYPITVFPTEPTPPIQSASGGFDFDVESL